MSIYSRDYMKDEDRYRRAGGPATWSIVIWLIVINVAVYLLNNLLFFDPRRDLFGLSLEALKSFRLWTPLTYQFIHASLWHLLANLLGLFFLGRMLLELVPSRHVLRIYLTGGFAGGALQLGWNAVFGPDASIVGASGSVLAITLAVATLIPHRRIQLLLFFIIPVSLTMRQVAWILIGINALSLVLGLVTSGGDGIAVMAHFGGILLGWAYIRFGWHDDKPAVRKKSAPSKRKGAFGVRILRDGEEEIYPGEDSGKKKPFVTSDVDAILDKINEHGFQSLTVEERQILEQSSRKLSRRIDGDA